MVEKTFQEITHPDDLFRLTFIKESLSKVKERTHMEKIFLKNNQTVYHLEFRQ
jgi:hypothetical protein